MIRLRKRARQWKLPIVLTLFVFVCFNNIFFIGYVPTGSMEPTLKTGSYIFGTRITREYQNGDIIIFSHNGQLLVKRIAACPGEEIDFRELSYMKNVAIPVWEDPILKVPGDCFFVLGDNIENSIDSRYWEDPFVHKETIVAKVIQF